MDGAYNLLLSKSRNVHLSGEMHVFICKFHIMSFYTLKRG